MQQRIIMTSLSMMMIVRFSRYLWDIQINCQKKIAIRICYVNTLNTITVNSHSMTEVFHDASDCNSLNLSILLANSITLEIGISDAEGITIITLFYI